MLTLGNSWVTLFEVLMFWGYKKVQKILNVEGGDFRLREGNAVHIGEFKCSNDVINTVFIIFRVYSSNSKSLMKPKGLKRTLGLCFGLRGSMISIVMRYNTNLETDTKLFLETILEVVIQIASTGT